MTGLTAAAALALVVGAAVYPWLPRGDEPPPRGRSRWWFDTVEWDWPLDPDLDRTDRAGASRRRRFQPRVPDWPTSSLVYAMRSAASAGIDYAFGANLYGYMLRGFERRVPGWAAVLRPTSGHDPSARPASLSDHER